MRKYRSVAIVIITAFSMLFLIVNAKNALIYASDAMKLCTTSLIPSLFPFMFLAILLNNDLTGYRFRFLQFIPKICRSPEGSESIFLLGILGGYPVGAQIISNAYENGSLKKEDAQRMLGFCNNAGPSFIFGIIGPLFHTLIPPISLWLIQIFSALMTGALLPGCSYGKIVVNHNANISATTALERSVKTMGLICGWVLLFRIMVGFINQKLSALFPKCLSILLAGLLELTNGSMALYSVENAGTRFILASLFLTIGGLCVALQTASAAKSLNMKSYMLAKAIQGIISVGFAYIIQYFIFPAEDRFTASGITIVIFLLLALTAIIFISCKKIVAFRNKLVYN